MVRPLLPLATLPHQNHTITLTFAFLAIFSVLVILTLLCASHNKIKKFKIRGSHPPNSTSNARAKRLFPGFTSNIGASGKALLKMVSWQRVQDEDEGKVMENVVDEDDEDVVWRKAIIMGERCRPLDFSGRIEYDCEGNPLPSDVYDDQWVAKINGGNKGIAIANK